jgi:FKBP-type peptidyl-prolyl cis-trans isomerase
MVQAPQAAPGAFKGTFENGLRLLSVGDSATILVPIDSLAKTVQAPLPPFLKPGTDLKYTVKILKVQSKADFEKEMAGQAAQAKADAAKLLAQQPAMIEAYIAKSGKKFTKTASGLFASIEKPGQGATPKMGESWIVNYRGTFLDGKEFDKGSSTEMPLGQMIPGFNGKPVNEYGIENNIWLIKNGMNKSTKDLVAFEHPAIFPEELAAKHIITWTKKDNLVYDPFMGSGTTAKMSILLDRNWIGSELDSTYSDICNRRLEGIVKQTSMFDEFIDH